MVAISYAWATLSPERDHLCISKKLTYAWHDLLKCLLWQFRPNISTLMLLLLFIIILMKFYHVRFISIIIHNYCQIISQIILWKRQNSQVGGCFNCESGWNNPNLHFIWSQLSTDPVHWVCVNKATLQSNLVALYSPPQIPRYLINCCLHCFGLLCYTYMFVMLYIYICYAIHICLLYIVLDCIA